MQIEEGSERLVRQFERQLKQLREQLSEMYERIETQREIAGSAATAE